MIVAPNCWKIGFRLLQNAPNELFLTLENYSKLLIISGITAHVGKLRILVLKSSRSTITSGMLET